jgi:hypothetical protein
MIGIGQDQPIGQAMSRAMGKGEARGWNALGAQQGVVGDHTQREHHAQAWHAGKLGLQEAIAGAVFDRQRQVFRRYAAYLIGDAAAGELPAILGVLTIGATREAVFQQGRIEQLAGIIPGERPPGAIWAIASTSIRTANLNGVDPQAWLTDVLEQMVSGKVNSRSLASLLPWAWRDTKCAELAA